MEALKLIPQIFFDLFARVVPGCAGLVSYLILFNKNWEAVITYLFGPAFAKESTTLSFLIFLGAGFLVGELLSPLAKQVQKINETVVELFSKKKKPKVKSKNPAKKDPDVEEKFSKEKLRYDRLRLEKPDIGALCAKIRGEFTMHNGLSVVFAIDSVYYFFSDLTFHWYIFTLLLVMTLLTAYRGATTNKTYNETVAKFTQLLDETKETALK